MTPATKVEQRTHRSGVWAWVKPGDNPVRWFGLRAAILALAVAALTAPQWLSPGDEYTAGLAVIAILFALSYNLLLGTTGMVSFGHAAFYGVGAFTVALIATKTHHSAIEGLVLSPFIGAISGLAIGAFCLRAVRLYFSLLTLAVSQLLYVAAFEAYSITGGDNGIHGINVPAFMVDPNGAYYFVLGVVAVGALILLVITHSPFGSALNAIRENRRRAAFIGISVKLYELAAFTIAASLASVAGALYAMYDQQAFPGLMFWTQSGTPVVMSLIGGMRVFFGPALGAAFYTILASKVQNTTIYWDLIIGVVLLVIVLALPGGLAGAPATIRGALFRQRRRGATPTPPTTGDLAAPTGADGWTSPAFNRVALSEVKVGSAIPAVAGAFGTLLTVRGLTKRFGGLVAADGVDLTVMRQSVHAIIGPNGAGKSTLFNLVSGDIRPDAGTVVFDGVDITGAPPQRLAHAGIGRAFQTTAVFPSLSVFDNVRLAIMGIRGDTRRPFGIASRLYRDRVGELLGAVGLLEHASLKASEMSHGDQRALELAISLAVGARLLLLDEPTAGMSPYETRQTLELLRTVTSTHGVTLLITEHDMEVVFGIARTVTVMAEGKVLAEGTPDQVRVHPDVIRVYLGSEA